MFRQTFLIVFLSLGLILVPGLALSADKVTPVKKSVEAPMLFVANGGQWPKDVLFGVRGSNNATYLEKDIITYQLFKTPTSGVVIKLHFLDANEAAVVSGKDKTESRFNFIEGKSSESWKTGMNAYQRVMYQNLYPHLDMEVSAGKSGAEYVFLVHEKQEHASIKVRVEGAKNLSVNKEGNLVITTDAGDIIQTVPAASYSDSQKKIPLHYEVVDQTTYALVF